MERTCDAQGNVWVRGKEFGQKRCSCFRGATLYFNIYGAQEWDSGGGLLYCDDDYNWAELHNRDADHAWYMGSPICLGCARVWGIRQGREDTEEEQCWYLAELCAILSFIQEDNLPSILRDPALSFEWPEERIMDPPVATAEEAFAWWSKWLRLQSLRWYGARQLRNGEDDLNPESLPSSMFWAPWEAHVRWPTGVREKDDERSAVRAGRERAPDE